MSNNNIINKNIKIENNITKSNINKKKSIKIGIGTKSPVKIKAVTNAINKIWPNKEIEIISSNIQSGVRDQPLSDEEGIDGAINRAEGIFRLHPDLDLSFGLEGTIDETEYGMMVYGWVIIIDNKGNIGTASSTHIMLPEIVAERIRLGEELGPIMEDITKISDVKQKGTASILTNYLIKRETEFENACIAAMARFIKPEFYEIYK